MAQLVLVQNNAVNISSAYQILNYNYLTALPIEVVCRLSIGSVAHPLSGAGGVYSIKWIINGSEVLPTTNLTVATTVTTFIVVSRSIAITSGDLVSIVLTGLVGDISVDVTSSLRDTTGASITDIVGSGLRQVTSDFGGVTDSLSYFGPAGQKISSATILVYNQSDYLVGNLGNNFIVARSSTDANGRLVNVLLLNVGVFVLVYEKPSLWGPDIKTITVT